MTPRQRVSPRMSMPRLLECIWQALISLWKEMGPILSCSLRKRISSWCPTFCGRNDFGKIWSMIAFREVRATCGVRLHPGTPNITLVNQISCSSDEWFACVALHLHLTTHLGVSEFFSSLLCPREASALSRDLWLFSLCVPQWRY